jgi:hypothetical protein
VETILFVVLLALLGERPARAYSDPGSGILLWQIVVSGFVGALFYLRKIARFWKKKDHH